MKQNTKIIDSDTYIRVQLDFGNHVERIWVEYGSYKRHAKTAILGAYIDKQNEYDLRDKQYGYSGFDVNAMVFKLADLLSDNPNYGNNITYKACRTYYILQRQLINGIYSVWINAMAFWAYICFNMIFEATHFAFYDAVNKFMEGTIQCQSTQMCTNNPFHSLSSDHRCRQ